MADQTGIEWADSTFNPWMGCSRVSPACDHCYAERDTARFGRVGWGQGVPRVRTAEANWRKPLRWNARSFWQCADCGWRGDTPRVDHADEDAPGGTGIACPACLQRDVRPARRRVFCASLADVFDNEVDPQWRADLVHLIFKTPHLDWLLLTKRIGNAKGMLEQAVASLSLGNHSWEHQSSRGFRHVWLGATICNQEEADRDVSKLLATPAAVRFLSIEPMLSAINVSPYFGACDCYVPCQEGVGMHAPSCPATRPRIEWVIVGGESGPNARPLHPEWVRSLRDQCAGAGVPFLFKQWGEWAPHACLTGGDEGGSLKRGHVRYIAGDGREPDGHFRRGDAALARVGKKVAGRALDGRTHSAWPSP
ncbi:hypothetical protein [Dolichospermum phage Dfl-JY45]